MTSIPPFPCPVCDAAFTGDVVATEATSKGVTVTIQRCPSCGLHITWPRLINPQGDYQNPDPDAWNRKYGAILRGERKHDRHANYQEQTASISAYVPRGGRILDVGCHAGWLLRHLQETGQFELEGLEPSPVLADIARNHLKLPVHQQYIQELDVPTSYDGIVATDVIEHINPEDMPAFGQAMARLLNVGGHIFLKTPNRPYVSLKARMAALLPRALSRRITGDHDAWDAKEHVIFWDTHALSQFVGRLGFSVVEVRVPLPVQTYNSPRVARLARSLIYRLARVVGGTKRVPFFAQDMWVIARKDR